LELWSAGQSVHPLLAAELGLGYAIQMYEEKDIEAVWIRSWILSIQKIPTTDAPTCVRD